MHQLLEIIDKIEEDVIIYNRDGVSELILTLIETLNELIKCGELTITQTINEILSYVQIGMKSNDYLLISDLLKYELRPILIALQINEGGCTSVSI